VLLPCASAVEWGQRACSSSCIEVLSKNLIVRAALCALLGLALAGCAELFGPSRPDPAAQMPALENRIFELVVLERTKTDANAKKLVLNQKLVTIARQRSSQMARTNSFAGDGDPHVSATMLMNQDAKFQGLVGENVAAQHYLPDQGIDVEAFAKRFVEGWAGSKPHLDNLSFGDYDRTGVGAAVNKDTVYVTQLFTTDLGLGDKAEQAAPDVQTVPSAQRGKDDSQGPALRGAIVPGQPTQ
jgi:uncharacterized protein YkwD